MTKITILLRGSVSDGDTWSRGVAWVDRIPPPDCRWQPGLKSEGHNGDAMTVTGKNAEQISFGLSQLRFGRALPSHMKMDRSHLLCSFCSLLYPPDSFTGFGWLILMKHYRFFVPHFTGYLTLKVCVAFSSKLIDHYMQNTWIHGS